MATVIKCKECGKVLAVVESIDSNIDLKLVGTNRLQMWRDEPPQEQIWCSPTLICGCGQSAPLNESSIDIIADSRKRI